MRVLFANFVNEMKKLASRPKYVCFLLFGLLICILSVAANIFIVRNTYGDMAEAAADIPVSMLYIATLMFVPAIIFIAAGDMFAGEIYDCSLQFLLVRPISRMKIYLSKIMALIVVSAVFLAVMLASAAALEFAIVRTVSDFTGVLIMYALDFIPLITVVMFAVLVNQFCSNAGFSIFMCTVIFLGVYALQVFVPTVGGVAFTNYLVWHSFWEGGEKLVYLIGDLGAMILYDVLFFIGGYWKFKSREI